MTFLKKLKVRLFLGKVPEICELSKGKIDYHDYKVNKGGDGTPSHFYTYTCWHCGKKFSI